MEEYPALQLSQPDFFSYGFGWFIQDYRGQQVWMHTGSIDGICAIIGLMPNERLGVYVLENLDHAEMRHALMYRCSICTTAARPRLERGAQAAVRTSPRQVPVGGTSGAARRVAAVGRDRKLRRHVSSTRRMGRSRVTNRERWTARARRHRSPAPLELITGTRVVPHAAG